MSIKKVVTAVFITALLLISSPCSATIYWSDLKIGDIYYDQPMDEVTAKFGKPLTESYGANNITEFIMYGFRIEGFPIWITAEDGAVVSATIMKKSNLTTSEGIGIGATIEDVKEVYGEPDHEKMVKIGGEKLRRLQYHTPIIEITDPQSQFKVMMGKLRFFIKKDNTVHIITFLYDYEN